MVGLHTRRTILACLAFVWLSAAAANAAPGDLDPSFGTHGTSQIKFGGKEATANQIVVASDGRIVVAGANVISNNCSREGCTHLSRPAVARFLPDGRADPDFGAGGQIQIGQSYDASAPVLTSDLEVASDESIGLITHAATLAMRLLTPTGYVRPAVDFGCCFGPAALEPLPDGSWMAAGYLIRGPGSPDLDFALARVLPDGKLDRSFANGGFAVVDFGVSTSIRSITILPDQRILAIGITMPVALDGGSRLAIARYLPDGSLDPTYGDRGKALVGPNLEWYSEIETAFAGGDAIVRATTIEPAFPTPYVLVRVTDQGQLDPAYGSNGVVALDPGHVALSRLLALPGGGLAGTSAERVELTDDEAVADPGWSGGDGARAPSDQLPGDIALDTQGRVVAVGTGYGYLSVSRYLRSGGPPDADADGTADSDDRCPEIAGPIAACPIFDRELSFAPTGPGATRGIAGGLDSARLSCARGNLEVYRSHQGKRHLIFARAIDYNGFLIRARRRAGRYLAIVKRSIDNPDEGICRRATARFTIDQRSGGR